MKKILFSIVFVLLVNQIIKAQDYFPLKVGNKFIYNSTTSSWIGDIQIYEGYKMIISIKKDTMIIGRKYYVREIKRSTNTFTDLVRVDSMTGSLYNYDSINQCLNYFYENLIDSLLIINGHEFSYCPNSSYDFIMDGAQSTTLFGFISFNKNFYYHPSSHLNIIHTYNSKFGYVNSYFYGSTGGHGSITSETIVGCIINDTLYGDTSTTLIKNISNEIPNQFSLYQNYPNPFNPTTKIKFEFPLNKGGLKGVVSLKVYDILGKEITTLVNEQLQPGTYEVTFNGNNLPSGVYFYQLRAGEFMKTKKLILLK